MASVGGISCLVCESQGFRPQVEHSIDVPCPLCADGTQTAEITHVEPARRGALLVSAVRLACPNGHSGSDQEAAEDGG
jgi:hypothetical protein